MHTIHSLQLSGHLMKRMFGAPDKINSVITAQTIILSIVIFNICGCDFNLAYILLASDRTEYTKLIMTATISQC